MNRLALISVDVDELVDVLHDAEPQESGAFFLLREGRGVRGRRLLAVDPIFPTGEAWEKQGEGQLRPSARWISAAISKAVTEHAGLLFVHSHPNPGHPIGFSPIDRSSILSLAETIGPILEGPFAAAVVHPEGWAAAVVDDGVLVPVQRIVSVGRALRLLGPPESVPRRRATDLRGLDDRQRDALGTVHDILQQLDVAVVGVGGIGSPVAEQLVRMGAGSVTLVDSDTLDTPSNVRRVVGSTPSDLRATSAPAKVGVVGRHLDQLGLGVPVHRIFGDVREERVWRELLDVDVVLGCTDTHSSRATLNDLVSAYLLPVIDVGVQAGAKKNADLAALVAEISVLTPVTPCLWCRGRISAEVIRAGNLPADQRDRLVREGYLVGGVDEPRSTASVLKWGSSHRRAGAICPRSRAPRPEPPAPSSGQPRVPPSREPPSPRHRRWPRPAPVNAYLTSFEGARLARGRLSVATGREPRRTLHRGPPIGERPARGETPFTSRPPSERSDFRSARPTIAGSTRSILIQVSRQSAPDQAVRLVPPGGVGPDLRRMVKLHQRLRLRLKRST